MKKLLAILILLTGLLTLPALAQDDVVEITFVHIFGEVENEEEITDVRIAVIQGIIDDFMAQNPNVIVHARSTSTDYIEVFNNSLAAMEQGDAPHIIQIEEGLTQLAVDSQLFVPIHEVANDEQLASLNDLLPQVREYYSVGGVLWGLPWNSSNPVMYYNKSMFDAAGLDPEVPPRTFDEMLSACEALMSGNEGLQACINWPMGTWFAEQWVAMQGGLIGNNGNGRSGRVSEIFYNSQEMVNVLTWWNEMADNGYYTYTGFTNNYNGEAAMLLTRRTAMSINSSGGISNFIELGERFLGEGVLGIAPLPLPDDDALNGITMGGASVWLSAGHSDAETQAAIDFMFFLTNTENSIRWFKGSGYFPNRTSAIDALQTEGWFDENPFFAIPVNQLMNSEVNIATMGAVMGPSGEVRSYLTEAFQSVIDGGEDIMEALQVATDRGNAELENYNSLFE